MSELKLDWAEDEARYQLEMSRLHHAFDSDSAAIPAVAGNFSWRILLPWILLAISVGVIALLLTS